MTTTIIIEADGNHEFLCRSGTTVAMAKAEIRERYCISGGGLDDANGPLIEGSTLIEHTQGAVKFVDGRIGSVPVVQARLGLEELLAASGGGGEYNVNRIPRMRSRFSSLVLQAVNEQLPILAWEIYAQTEALPQTQTEQALSIVGYKLIKPWQQPGNDSLTLCFKGTKAHLLKVLTPKEYQRALALQQSLGGEDHAHLTKFDLQSHGLKRFMIMPLYISTLQAIDHLSIKCGQRVTQQLSGALLFLHEKGFIHMDVKPSNVCLNEAGDAVLVDLGSCVRRSSASQISISESTIAYVPPDFQLQSRDNLKSNEYIAEELCDWWMLAMTVAEKVYQVPIGRATPSPNRLQLRDMVQVDFPDLADRLTIE